MDTVFIVLKKRKDREEYKESLKSPVLPRAACPFF